MTLQLRETVLEKEHPDTLVSMNSLSFTTQGQGRNLGAIKLMAECVHLQGMFLLARLWRLARVWGCFWPSTSSRSASVCRCSASASPYMHWSRNTLARLLPLVGVVNLLFDSLSQLIYIEECRIIPYHNIAQTRLFSIPMFGEGSSSTLHLGTTLCKNLWYCKT